MRWLHLGKISRRASLNKPFVGYMPDSEAEITAAQSHRVLESQNRWGNEESWEREKASVSHVRSDQEPIQALSSDRHEGEWAQPRVSNQFKVIQLKHLSLAQTVKFPKGSVAPNWEFDACGKKWHGIWCCYICSIFIKKIQVWTQNILCIRNENKLYPFNIFLPFKIYYFCRLPFKSLKFDCFKTFLSFFLK